MYIPHLMSQKVCQFYFYDNIGKYKPNFPNFFTVIFRYELGRGLEVKQLLQGSAGTTALGEMVVLVAAFASVNF